MFLFGFWFFSHSLSSENSFFLLIERMLYAHTESALVLIRLPTTHTKSQLGSTEKHIELKTTTTNMLHKNRTAHKSFSYNAI